MTKPGKVNFFQYLLNEPENWGIQLITAGYYHAPPNAKYPPPGHPETHDFKWSKGRKLDGYYIIYIPTGAGQLDLIHSSSTVQAGDVILTYTNDWHRYKPRRRTGWEEYWVGFKGDYIEKSIIGDLFPQGGSYIKKIGYQPEIILLFNQFIELSQKKSATFRKVLPGCLLQLIAHFTTPPEEKVVMNRSSFIVDKSIAYLRQNLSKEVDFHGLAESFNLSYSRYRSIFKEETGCAPNQFLLNERIEYAKRLLKNTDLPVSQIAFTSGFQSAPYFTRLFLQKTGLTPSKERMKKN